jgi:2-oxoglutarate dehydrogenase E2 component (dihydrolipoamide succinyltransferase)
MKIEVLMPKMGESITEGKIVRWHKKMGEKIEKDEILLEISTDKVDTEIPSAASGTLSEIVIHENEVAQVGTVIAYIETETDVSRKKQAAEPKIEAYSISEKVVGIAETGDGKRDAEGSFVSGRNGDRFLSPLVRSIAKTEGISTEELTAIAGSGQGGRITKDDVRNYVENRSRGHEIANKKQDVRSQVRGTCAPPKSTNDEMIPMDDMRQLIMEHMVKSRDTSVHVAAITEVNMSAIAEFIAKRGEEFEKQEGFKLTFMPFIAHACIRSLKDFPLVNSSIEVDPDRGNGTNIIQHNYVNLGIAVAIETGGLLVPVIKGADEKSLLGLARAIRDVASRARTKRLVGEDAIGSTFSITNYGVFGNLMGTPIINQPNVAILGVGAVKKRPVVINDAIAIRQMAFLTLSFDHRLIDGALGGQFLERIVYYLQNFDTKQVF